MFLESVSRLIILEPTDFLFVGLTGESGAGWAFHLFSAANDAFSLLFLLLTDLGHGRWEFRAMVAENIFFFQNVMCSCTMLLSTNLHHLAISVDANCNGRVGLHY